MTTSPELLVVGAGPTGLTLALQAHALGMPVRVIDRRVAEFRPSRALLLHARTLEVLRPLDVVDGLLAKSYTAPTILLHGGTRPMSMTLANFAMADTEFPHLTIVRQSDLERVLAAALTDRGVPVERGTELVELDAVSRPPRVALRTDSRIRHERYDWVAGCDGATSAVRVHAGIGWSSTPYRHEVLLADIELTDTIDPDRMHAGLGRSGLCLLFPCGEAAAWRMLATQRTRDGTEEPNQFGPPPPPTELVRALAEASIPAHILAIAWSSRVHLWRGLADSYRSGGVFVAGDAAHVQSPAAGQGMNTGIQDAVNLGWKLAFADRSSRPSALLDSYERERRPVARAVRRLTDVAFQMESGTDPITSWLRGSIAPQLTTLAPAFLARQSLLARGFRVMAQLNVGYRRSVLSPFARAEWAHRPRPGDRLPDAVVTVDGRAVSLHALIASPAVHLLIGRHATASQTDARIQVHRVEELTGSVAIAVRPDGYVGAIVRDTRDVELADWLALVGTVACSPD